MFILLILSPRNFLLLSKTLQYLFTFQLSWCTPLLAEGWQIVTDFRQHQIRWSCSLRVRQGGWLIPGIYSRRKYFQQFLGRKPESEKARRYDLYLPLSKSRG